ncbi:hypothetical protein AAC387_Pa02g4826 [Persea americana]
MMTTHLRFSLLLAFFCLISVAVSAFALSNDLLGLAPQDVGYYEYEMIKCKDGSKEFKKEQLNDDFCDCPDGTDEPGTSACPDGKFYCQNVGHSPLTLFSSRVNDGICDCCDGTDEYDDKVKCPNTCWEAGKLAKDKLKKKIATYQDGVNIRKKEVENAKQAIAKDNAELSKLKNEEKILKGLVQQLKDQKNQIEKAEEQERLEKEKEEERLKEAEKNESEQMKQLSETSHAETKEIVGEQPFSWNLFAERSDAAFEAENDDKAGREASLSDAAKVHAVEDIDDNMVKDENDQDAVPDSVASSNHLKQDRKSDDNEGLSRDELGRLVASRWTGENTGHQDYGSNDAKDKEHESKPEVPKDTHNDEHKSYISETDEDSHRYSDEEMDEDTDGEYEDDDLSYSYNSDVEDDADFLDTAADPSGPSWLDKIQQTVQNILEAVNLLKTPIDKSEADRVRKEYDDADQKLSKLQSRISSLTNKLKEDLGMEKEFYSFYGRCFENKQTRYVYKVCPFKKATQVEGHSTTKLGYWDGFNNSYSVMQFTDGDGCWKGPNRSLKVRLECGLDNELTDIDEPSRCEYVALLSTPALCLEGKLKELQDELDLMNADQPQIHDEL